MKNDDVHSIRLLILLSATILAAVTYNFYCSLNVFEKALFFIVVIAVSVPTGILLWRNFSKSGREHKKRLQQIRDLPSSLITKNLSGIQLGLESDLKVPIFLPDSIRTRHVHIIGATGSGKTESVILNFLKQDLARGLGAIIIDGKGDISFLESLNQWIPKEKLKVFDLGSVDSTCYDPLKDGSPLEAAQRLYSSLTWSEEYYASKARSVLQIIFQKHFIFKKRNPTLKDLFDYLENPGRYTAFTASPNYPHKIAEQDYIEISGLRDQVSSLCTGHLIDILSASDKSEINFSDATSGHVIYFRLQSLMSPQIAATVGKLVINHLNYMAGTAHRKKKEEDSQAANKVKLVPTYVDEFATFACDEFADLISKARSAGLALHFSHQSIGDLAEVSKGFLNRITDNSATKIVMRINDPDSADFFARSFGTKLYQKFTQRVTNSEDTEQAEAIGEGSVREAHQFRASPDLFKTLPTGMASVLIAHGYDTPQGASAVFKIKFPELRPDAGQIVT